MGQQLCTSILESSKCTCCCNSSNCQCQIPHWLRRLCFCVVSCCICCDSSSSSHGTSMGPQRRSSSPDEGPDIPLAQIDAMERRKTRRSLVSFSNRPSKESSSQGGQASGDLDRSGIELTEDSDGSGIQIQVPHFRHFQG